VYLDGREWRTFKTGLFTHTDTHSNIYIYMCIVFFFFLILHSPSSLAPTRSGGEHETRVAINSLVPCCADRRRRLHQSGGLCASARQRENRYGTGQPIIQTGDEIKPHVPSTTQNSGKGSKEHPIVLLPYQVCVVVMPHADPEGG
jgi:hypothetical protein